MISICEDCGQSYRITYGPVKTVISVIVCNADISYYSDVKQWKMDDHPITVKEDNDHLGLIVSNVSEAEKNIDLKIKKSRGALFKLMGPTFSSKCLLNPTLKLHLFRTFVAPIVRPGLSSMTLSLTHIPRYLT